MSINIYKQALEEIAEINDLSIIECDEGLTKLLYELNDRFLTIQSIVKSTLRDEKREEAGIDQTADQSQDSTEPQFDPFPDEIDACPECGKPMLERNGKRGKFYGCSGFPACRYTRDSTKIVNHKSAVHKSDVHPHYRHTMDDPGEPSNMEEEVFRSCCDPTGHFLG